MKQNQTHIFDVAFPQRIVAMEPICTFVTDPFIPTRRPSPTLLILDFALPKIRLTQREWQSEIAQGMVGMNRFASFLATILGLAAMLSPAAAQGPTIHGCPVLPANNIWNTRIDGLPVDVNSDNYIARIGPNDPLHPDFGSGTIQGRPFGIPFITVGGTQPPVPIRFQYADESDPGPYPIPPNVPIEGGKFSTGDRHILVIDVDHCLLYEAYRAVPLGGGKRWLAGSGAVYNLTSNALRPAGWTSADAAGLPIFPGLCRKDEVVAGEIKHALRFTVSQTRNQYVWPARHEASSNSDPNLPPMGQRFRLKANYDISGYPPDARVILTALKRYGMILADNGSDWFFSGTQDNAWDNDVLNTLKNVRGSDFEAVDVSPLLIDANSGQALQP